MKTADIICLAPQHFLHVVFPSITVEENVHFSVRSNVSNVIFGADKRFPRGENLHLNQIFPHTSYYAGM